MSDPSSIRCNMRPSDAWAKRLGIVHPKPAIPIGHALDTVLVIQGLERLLDTAIGACRTADGRVDMRDVAHRVMVALDQLRGAKTLRVKDVIDDSTAVNSFARLITEAIELFQAEDGKLDLHGAAAHIFAAMRENQR
jgi:hypothetical protein